MNALRVGGLCAGYGGLEMGLAQVLDTELVWFADLDPGAAAVLAYRWPGVPNHGDLTTTDWATVEPVDIVTAGWPCQPWSAAGKRRGAADERAIWPSVADAVRLLRPGLVVLENVPAVVAAGELARAVGDLAAFGYDACWACVRAADVGAPHKRERVFIVAAFADSASIGWGEGWPEPARQCGGPDVAQRGDAAPDPDPDGDGLPVVGEGPERDAWDDADGRGPIDWAGYGPAIARWAAVLGRPAPGPTVLGKRGGRQLSPAFVEFLMGLPEGWVTDVPGLSRNQMLKILGNGCVPLQCEAALRHLLPLLSDVVVAA